MLITIIIFLITILLLVLSHEFGHFITAKKFGIKVLEFGFGLPPRLIGKKINDTIYSINLFPLGGFVRLFGEDEVDKKILEDKDSFASKPVFQRMAVVVAGVTANFILAAIIFWGVLIATGFEEKIPLLTPYHFFGVEQTNESMILIGKISPGSPAASAGLSVGDQILKFDNTKLEDAEQLINLTKKYAGEKVKLTVMDSENKVKEIEVAPRLTPPQGEGPLGVLLGTVTVAKLTYATPMQKAASGLTRTYNLTVYSFDIIKSLIAQSFETHKLEPVSESVSGPVGIVSLIKTIVQSPNPLIPYFNLLGLLSLSLGMINILPIPALDGGRLFFLLIEAVVRKKVKAEIEKWVHMIGMILLIGLIILITFSDIKKIFP